MRSGCGDRDTDTKMKQRRTKMSEVKKNQNVNEEGNLTEEGLTEQRQIRRENSGHCRRQEGTRSFRRHGM